jgi:hypothetical protein
MRRRLGLARRRCVPITNRRLTPGAHGTNELRRIANGLVTRGSATFKCADPSCAHCDLPRRRPEDRLPFFPRGLGSASGAHCPARLDRAGLFFVARRSHRTQVHHSCKAPDLKPSHTTSATFTPAPLMSLVRFDPGLSTSTSVASPIRASTVNAVPHGSFFYDLLRYSTTKRRKSWRSRLNCV